MLSIMQIIPLGLLVKLKKYLKRKGKFFITTPCYPHTLTEFAKKNKTLSKKAESYIDFGVKKLEPFIKKKKKKYFILKIDYYLDRKLI